MNIALVILIIFLVLWIFYKLLNYSGGGDEYSRDTRNYNRNPDNYDKGEEVKTTPKKSIFSVFSREKKVKQAKRQSFFERIFSAPLPFDDAAITWCANFLAVEKNELIDILKNTSIQYSHFKLGGKRSGGCRTISAPNNVLLNIQKTIYKRILLSVSIHSAATGFRQNVSVIHNAKVHLGKTQIIKVDLADFFGSIKKPRIITAFEKIGYPSNISKVLAELCSLDGKLPQGAATSPTLSNIIAYDMDVKLIALARKHNLTYSRYADDLTFSGEDIAFELFLSEIDGIVREEKFVIQRKKTRFLTENKKKDHYWCFCQFRRKTDYSKIKKTGDSKKCALHSNQRTSRTSEIYRLDRSLLSETHCRLPQLLADGRTRQ